MPIGSSAFGVSFGVSFAASATHFSCLVPQYFYADLTVNVGRTLSFRIIVAYKYRTAESTVNTCVLLRERVHIFTMTLGRCIMYALLF